MGEEKRKRHRVDYDASAFIEGVSQRLTPEQVGVYWMLCSMMYEAGGPIAYDARGIANSFAQTNARTVTRIVDSLISLGKIEISLPISDSSLGNSDSQVCPYLSNRRTMEEIKRTQERIENGRKFGPLGGRPKAENSHSAAPEPFSGEKGHPFENGKASRARETFNVLTSNESTSARSEKANPPPNLLARLREAGKGNIDETSTGILNLAPLLGLVANGADVDLDILPAIANSVPRLKKPLRSWAVSWLHEEISEWRANRLRKAGATPMPASDDQVRRMHRLWVERYLDTGGAWEPGWGPLPGDEGCVVPIELVREIFTARGRDLTAHLAGRQSRADRYRLEA